MYKQLFYVIPLLGAVFLFTSACDNGQEVTDNTPIIEEEEAPSPLVANEDTIEVQLSEYSIEMPNPITAGETIFRVTNVGEIPHNFEVEGNGIEKEFETSLEPGETETMVLELEPGTYEVYCPIGDHAEQGMSMELSVVEPESPQAL